MKKRALVTDVMFPNKYATWRNNEILSFIDEFDTDILIFKIDSFAGNKFDFDWDFHNKEGVLEDYNILIFDEKYNHLNIYNKRIDGTKFNGKINASYLLTKYLDFDIGGYDFIYHIFLMCYTRFNKVLSFDLEKQFIHLYPGGGISYIDNVVLVDRTTNVISTHPRTSKKLNDIGHNKYINAFLGTLMKKGETFIESKKKENGYINICFSSLGESDDKGNRTYIDLVNFYNNFKEKKIKFWAVGNFDKSENIEVVPPMDYLSLAKFYQNNIDIYINAETGKFFNGWPLGTESLINGSVIVTTDPNNDYSSYFLQNSGIFTFKDFNELTKIIDYFYENSELLRYYSKISQKNLEKYLLYENQQNKIFEYIKSIIK